jgi:site-specific recombinase XerD
MTPAKSTSYVRRLGAHHFAHLRAVAEGVEVADSAARYLGVEHKASAKPAHAQVVDLVRGLGRRAGDSRWRLVGVRISSGRQAPAPDIEDFIAERELDGWSESEVLDMYLEAFPPTRAAARAIRLREKQLAVLKVLESSAAQTPAPTDPIDAWFDDISAQRFRASGLLMLSDLVGLIAQGGNWYRGIPAVGKGKAERIAAYLQVLLPGAALAQLERREASSRALIAVATGVPAVLDGSRGMNRAQRLAAGTQANTDEEAITGWIEAKAGSKVTARVYRGQAERFVMWCRQERHKPLSSVDMHDCLGYMTFLQHIPPSWISKRNTPRLQPGWTPFAGPLSASSQRQAVIIVAALFDWLCNAGYLIANPWLLVNRKTGDTETDTYSLESRAFSPRAWSAVTEYIGAMPPGASRDRLQFIFSFIESTGLRSSELVAARIGDLKDDSGMGDGGSGRLFLRVKGKGSQFRSVALPSQARAALEAYFSSRGLNLDAADNTPSLPILASLNEPGKPVQYSRLYQMCKTVLRSAALHSQQLTRIERERLASASTHWLRHTFGTRATERGVPLDVVKEQMGHSDIRTTTRYTRAQHSRMADEIDRAFG